MSTPTAPLNSTPVQIDHFVILLSYPDLCSPPTWVTKHFTVMPGGVHSDGMTENRLVLFEDGTYIELVAFRPGAEDRAKAEHPWGLKKPGFVDFCLTTGADSGVPPNPNENQHTRTNNGSGDGENAPGGSRDTLKKDLALENYKALKVRLDNGIGGGRGGCGGAATAKALSIDYSPPKPGGRKMPDGKEIQWNVTFPVVRNPNIKSSVVGEVPFWCHDITPRSLRVDCTNIKYTTHPSGAKGIAQFTVLVPKERMESYIHLYSSILDTRPVRVLDTARLELRTPISVPGLVKPWLFIEYPTLSIEAKKLEERGPGLVELALRLGVDESAKGKASVGLGRESITQDGVWVHFLK